MAAPFFSVIIPVYNRAAPLCAAIASVRAQTCQDFEILVVDDGSQDDPGAVAESFGDPRIRVIRKANAGGGAARNTGVAQAQGRYVAFLDSDDAFLPHHLASMRTLLEREPASVGYARVRVDRGGDRVFLKPPRALREGEAMANYLLCARGFTPTSTLVVEREAARAVGFDEHLRVAEDTDFAIRLSLAGRPFRMLEEPGAVWRDLQDETRLSSSRGGGEFAAWLAKMKPLIPARAWHGGRGWAYAKLIAGERPLAALGLYLNALLRGCYAPSLAGVVALQILLGRIGYRRVADQAIRWLHVGLREPAAKPARKLEQA